MALRSDQAKILRRKVVRSTFIRIAVFTLAVALAAVGFTFFLRDSVADFVADNTSRWVPLNSDAQLQQVLRDNGLMDTSVASVTSRNNYQPTPAEGEEVQRISRKIQRSCDAIAELAETL